MKNRELYSKVIIRSVEHIFKQFLGDDSIEEVFDTQSNDESTIVVVEIDGMLRGEVVITLPTTTLDEITKHLLKKEKSTKKHHADVAGEIVNMITGTFANQMQFVKYELILSPPVFDDDPIAMKALYENVNLSFSSRFGGFDVDLYYKEKVKEYND